jgi:putative N6-adenine-specific DNA methylase
MDNTNHKFFAPCPRGLEAILADELKELGASTIEPTAGGVAFRGTLALCYLANFQSRIASRILLHVAEAP